MGTNSRKGSWSAKRNEHKTFIQGLTPKTKLASAPDNIKPPEGNIDSQTESTDQYQKHSQVQRQKKVVINDGIDAPAGKLSFGLKIDAISVSMLDFQIKVTKNIRYKLSCIYIFKKRGPKCSVFCPMASKEI